MPDGRVARFEVPEGTTPEQAQSLIEAELPKISAPQPDTESNWTLGNLGESFARGLKQRGAGVLELGSKLAESAGVTIPEEYKQGIADIQNQYSQEGRGTGTVGLVGEVIGDPLTYIPIGGGAKNIVKGLAGAGALSGITTSTGDAESTLGDMLTNAGIQAGTGAIAGKVTQKLMKPVSSGLDDVAAKNVSMLEREGVKLQPSQKTGSKALNLMEEAFKGLPFTSGKQARINEAQLGQFTKAALRRAGINSDKATPEVLEAAAKSFGDRYDDLISKAGGIKIDDDLLGALVAADTEASRRLGSDSVGRMVHSYIDDVLEAGGKLDAKTYQNTRRALGRIAKGTQDPLLANVLTDLRNALDAAAERSMTKGLSSAWRATDKQYAAFKTIQKAMERTGQEATSGYITPANLLNAVKVGNKRFSRGYGELNPLARAGKDIISSTLPDSGTATRTQMQNVLTGGALAGGGATASGLTGAGAALFAPRVIQEVYNTRPVQRYLTKGITESSAPIIGAAKAAIQAARQEAMPSGEPVPQANTPDAGEMQPPPAQQPAPVTNSPQSSLTQQNEGFSNVVYKDTTGNPTIGYGFNLNSGIAAKAWKQAGLPMKALPAVKAGKLAITKEHAQALYRASEKIAVDDAMAYFGDGFDGLSQPQKLALVDMSYQMGLPRLNKFRDLKRHIKTKNAHGIVQSIKRSEYAQQTPERAGQIAQLLLQFN